MPFYTWKCDACGNEFEVFSSVQSFKDYSKTKCKCGSKSIYQVYGVPQGKIEGEYKTLGSLAEANTKKLSPDEYNRKCKQANFDKKARENHKFMRKLARATPEQKEKYIHTGQI